MQNTLSLPKANQFMFKNIQIKNILFIDIETVPAYPNYDDMPQSLRYLWDQKAERIKKTDSDTSDQLYEKAGIYAEFGKIICISTAYIHQKELRVKSFFGDNEKDILQEFASLLNKYFSKSSKLLCAHNGKEFDYPYLARRMLINQIKLPNLLNIAGKKPWQIPHLDTMELWKFGDYKHYTSLALLTEIFGIANPKDDIDGGDIAKVYYDDNDLERIVHYCQKDVIALTQLFLKYQGHQLIHDKNILIQS